jgi:hypothetical protein
VSEHDYETFEAEGAIAQTVEQARLWGFRWAINDDPYGRGIMRYAAKWARLMEAELQKGLELTDIAQRTSHEADTDGITGFMYGAAVAELSVSWQYGEELKRWHNGEYGQPDAQGVVNPAIITIGSKEDV